MGNSAANRGRLRRLRDPQADRPKPLHASYQLCRRRRRWCVAFRIRRIIDRAAEQLEREPEGEDLSVGGEEAVRLIDGFSDRVGNRIRILGRPVAATPQLDRPQPRCRQNAVDRHESARIPKKQQLCTLSRQPP